MNMQRHYGTAKFSHKSGIIKKSVRLGGNPVGHKANKNQGKNTTKDPIAQELLSSGFYSGVEVYNIMRSGLYDE